MKAIEINRFGGSDQFTLGQRDKPIPREGEVCILIKAAGFNPVDYKMRQGWYEIDPHQILGCECSGIVDALGPNTGAFTVGDEVYAICGSFFRSSNGSYAEYVSVPIELVHKKPKNLSFEEAAAVPLAAMTAYRATLAAIHFQKDHPTIFVAGIGGGVGTFIAQFLKIAGIKEIYTIAKDEKSAKYIHQELDIPSDHILIYEGRSTEEMHHALKNMNGKGFFDVTIDLVGGPLKQLCLELTSYSGHFSTVVPEANFRSFDIWSENSIPRGRNLSIHQVAIGAELSSSNRNDWEIYPRHMALISQWIEKGLLKPKIENIGTLSIQTVNKAHALLESGHTKGKLVMHVA